MNRVLALAAMVVLLLVSLACGAAEPDAASEEVGAPPAPPLSLTQVTGEETDEEPAEEPGAPPGEQREPLRRRVEAEAPLRMRQGRAARFFLSFGPEELPPNLPGLPESQGGGATIEIPEGGTVSPQLTAVGPVRIEAVDAEPVAAGSPAAKRWIWQVTVPLTATLDVPSVLLTPSLRYTPPGDGPVEVIWPLEPFDIEVEIHPRSQLQTMRLFARGVQSELTFFGFSLAGFVSGSFSLLRWLLPRLRRRVPPRVG